MKRVMRMSNNPNQPINRMSIHSAMAHYGELQDGDGERLAAKTEQTDGMLNDSLERMTIVASPRHEPQMFSSAIDGHAVHCDAQVERDSRETGSQRGR